MARYLLIANPFSSRGLDDASAAAVAAKAAAAGVHLEVFRTSAAGDAEALVARDAPAYDGIITAGGDGTIAEAVNGLARCGGKARELPIGILPCGAGNVLAKELGIPWNPLRAMDIILAGRRRMLDCGVASAQGPRGEAAAPGARRRFLLMASAGYDAAVVHEAHRGRRGSFGRMYFVAPALRVLARGGFAEIEVEIAGGTVLCRHVVVANVAEYGGPFVPAPDARPDDGMFDVVMYTRPGRARLIACGLGALARSRSTGVGVVRMRASEVTLSSRRGAPFQMDGDPAGTLPRTLGIEPRSVTVFAPPPRSETLSD